VSDLVAGKVSDNYFFLESRLMDLLDKDDSILCDQVLGSQLQDLEVHKFMFLISSKIELMMRLRKYQNLI
jgi:hypothetical protein